MSHQYLSKIDVRKGYGLFYILDNIAYDSKFPIEWAMTHPIISNKLLNKETGKIEIEKEYRAGPKTCDNCLKEGVVNGVFLHYCKKCSQYCYQFELFRKEISKKDNSEIGYQTTDNHCFIE